MKRITVPAATAAVAMIFIAATAAPAQQQASARQVSATGTATITARPEIVRVTVQLRSEGSSAREAVDKLAADIKSAREKLTAAGISADAVKVSEPTLGAQPLNPQQQQMRMVMQMRSGGAAKAAATSQPSVVTAVLTADVPLKSTDGPSLLLAANELQDKVKAAFKHDTKAMTPEEREVMEEMQQQQQQNGEAAAQPGEPAFLYVHVLSDAEQAKALADAFAAAKDSATRIAKAAGSDAREVLQVSGSAATANGDNQNAYFAYVAAMNGGGGTQGAAGSVASEATAAQAGPVTCTVTVRADFALK